MEYYKKTYARKEAFIKELTQFDLNVAVDWCR